MLTTAKNELLTRVGPGTPMGNLLRRYWMPIGGACEFDTIALKPIRLMGENLVLYKDQSGRFGLVDRHCPHRRADLSNGWVESAGIRCSYHGWLMDQTGACIEQPYEDTANPRPTKDNCRINGSESEQVFARPVVPHWEPREVGCDGGTLLQVNAAFCRICCAGFLCRFGLDVRRKFRYDP